MPQPNYRIQLSFDGERKVFIARAPELEHCFGEGPTRGAALAKVEEEIEAQIQNIHAHGSLPPVAVDEETFTGDVTLKVSKTLHRDLVWQARAEGIELDQMMGELLSAAMEGRRATRAHRPGGNRVQGDSLPHDNIGNAVGSDRGSRPRAGFGQRSTAMLDDRATFIEYVRGLENGQAGGGHGGVGGGNGGGAPGRGGPDNRRRRRGGARGPGGPGGGPNRGPGGNGNGTGNKV